MKNCTFVKVLEITKNRFVRWIGLVLACAVLLLLPRFTSPYIQMILFQMGIGVVLAYGFRLIFLIGRFTLGHAAFMGLGAYTAALLSTKLGISFWFGLLAGGIVSAIIAVIFGYIVLRITGIYFVIMTLAFSEIMGYWYNLNEKLTGGTSGLSDIPAPSIGGFSFGVSPAPYYYLILVLVGVTLFTMYRIEHSPLGLAIRAVGQNDMLAEHIAINVTNYRVLAFSIACFFAGLAGAVQAHFYHYVSPEDFGMAQSLYVQIYSVVGGLAYVLGPLVGTPVVMGIGEVFRIGKQVQPIFYGTLLVLVMVFLPGGLSSLPRVLSAWFRKSRATRPSNSSISIAKDG